MDNAGESATQRVGMVRLIAPNVTNSESATVALGFRKSDRRSDASSREVGEHFDAVSSIYYEMVDAYKTDLAYYHARELEEAAKWARIARPGRALDAGSGPGRHTFQLLEMGFDVISLDLSRKMLAELERGGSTERVRNSTTGVQGDIRALPFKSASFDLVICMEVIEHLPTHPELVERTVRELARVLRPNGYLILEFPLRLHSLLRLLPGSAVDWKQVRKPEWYLHSPPPLRYQRRFPLREVQRILSRARLSVRQRIFLRVIPSGYASRFPRLDNADRILEKVPLVRHFARETILVLQRQG